MTKTTVKSKATVTLKETLKTVQFIEHHRPSLQSGTYTITVTQTLKNEEISSGKQEFKSSRTFHVEGEQFSLNPQTVYSVFPPAGSAACYDNVLPSIILRRSTLPWERSAQQPPWIEKSENTDDKSRSPWLALLLFHKGEVDKPQVTPIKDVMKEPYVSKYRSIDREKDQVSLLQVPTDLLKKLVPSPKALNLLSHVRKGKHEDETDVELAVVMGDRLPAPGINTVHLVSLENFIQEGASDPFTRLVSLHTWEFVCNIGDTEEHFKKLLTNLNVGTLRLDSQNDSNDNDTSFYLKQGYIPLKHHLRNFQTTVSWYHSPLSPVKLESEKFTFNFPVRAADRLLIYHENTGLFDSSYAAAWQLGRLLALQDKAFSTSLFNWKRQYLQQQSMAKENISTKDPQESNTDSEQPNENNLDSIQLLFQPQQLNTNEIEVPQNIINWFKNLMLLDNIPFNYLVPDPDLLPEESLRCFYVDTTWIDCAVDAAFGIGNVLNDKSYKDCKEKILSAIHYPKTMTGFLIRSEAIAHYPSLEIVGDTKNSEGCLPLRRERLSNGVLICLFEGELKSIKINQKPEALHFGFQKNNLENTNGLSLMLRNPNTGESYSEQDSRKIKPINMLNIHQDCWKDRNEDLKLKIIDMVKLEKTIRSSLNNEHNSVLFLRKSLTSSQLALELIEGGALIEFTLEFCRDITWRTKKVEEID